MANKPKAGARGSTSGDDPSSSSEDGIEIEVGGVTRTSTTPLRVRVHTLDDARALIDHVLAQIEPGREINVDGATIVREENPKRYSSLYRHARQKHHEAFRQRVQERMLELGLNQTALSKKTNISQSQISKFLRGEQGLALAKEAAIRKALGLDQGEGPSHRRGT